jgi:hypothetical protein
VIGEGPSGAEEGVTPGPRARRVAVVIRLDADVKTLDRCLDAFLAQEGAGSIEWAGSLARHRGADRQR